MANIFKENQAVNDNPKRNNFDLSKKSNVTMKLGTLYPVYCQPVVPGDSFSIETAYNMKLKPVVFPVQTKIRAHMHYFYVRNKNLWENWENWISNLVSNEDHPHPYIAPSENKVTTGSIHDFLGVPTTLVRNETEGAFLAFPDTLRSFPAYYSSNPSLMQIGVQNLDTMQSSSAQQLYESGNYKFLVLGALSNYPIDDKFNYNNAYWNDDLAFLSTNGYYYIYLFDSDDHNFLGLIQLSPDGDLVFTSSLSSAISEDQYHGLFSSHSQIIFCLACPTPSPDFNLQVRVDPNLKFTFQLPVTEGFIQYKDSHLHTFESRLHLSALPYRAYESIYNAYYRNNVVDPLKINGQVAYNRYNTNLSDGLDNTDYKLFQRNYELDFLTSALPSPQQGVAPLVGMTALGDITIEDENGITTAHATIDNDDKITKVVLTSPAASNEHARTAMNIAASGMSINDFRNTNALQRVLETNIRKGYRYLDFIAGHFGKEPDYRELDMPEFIGGFSRDVQVSTVVSSADTLGADSGATLGDYGGYASLVGNSNHAINHYCDDYGFIIGIMSIVPTPCYSQLLNKYMVAPNNFLDYYFPEFSQIGLQPLPYELVSPLQSDYMRSIGYPVSLQDTFGYQRPNWDMVSAVDEVHGEFRSTLRQYVINRIFADRPELGHDFLAINPSEVNDIFVDTNAGDDTIIGEIGFSVHAKRPVPRVVIPGLGR